MRLHRMSEKEVALHKEEYREVRESGEVSEFAVIAWGERVRELESELVEEKRKVRKLAKDYAEVWDENYEFEKELYNVNDELKKLRRENVALREQVRVLEKAGEDGDGGEKAAAHKTTRRDWPLAASIMALISEEFKKDFEEVWKKAELLSAFPVPVWDWDVARFELMAFLYVHALCFAQHKGRCIASLFPDSVFKKVYADFLYEVERCVRFDVCWAMRGTIGGDEQVEKLLEDRYAVYSPEVGKELRTVVARFVCLVQCSLKDGVDGYDSRLVSKALINPILTMDLDCLMRDFVITCVPDCVKMLTSEKFLISVEKKAPWVIRNEVLRFAELAGKGNEDCKDEEQSVVKKSEEEVSRGDERKPESFLVFSCRFKVLCFVIVVSSLFSAFSVKSLYWGVIALVCYMVKLAVALCVPVVLHLFREKGFGVFFSVMAGVVSWVLMAGYGGFLEYELGIGNMVFPVSFVSGATTAWFAFMAYRVMRSSCSDFRYLW